MCPVCGEQTSSLGLGNTIQPFWERISSFFLYPAQSQPLILMAILSLLAAWVKGGLIGTLLLGAIAVVFLKYAYTVLEDSAQGYMQARDIRPETLSEELELPFKQMAILFIFSFLEYKAVGWLGEFGYWLSSMLTNLVIPATVMVLAVEHSLLKAINPVYLLNCIARIGMPYFLLWVFLYMLSASTWIAIDIFYDIFPRWLFFSIFSFTIMYFVLIMFNMMGYMIYQYHEILGYDLVIEEATPAKKSSVQPQQSPLLQAVDVQIREGQLDQARQSLIKLCNDYPTEDAVWQKLLTLLAKTGKHAELQTYVQNYTTRLFGNNKLQEAAKLYVNYGRYTPGLKPAKAIERHEIAKWLFHSGYSKQALSIINNLHVDFPAYDQIPAAYLLAAKISCEKLNDDKTARAILDFVLQRYPDCTEKAEIEAYQQVIAKLN